MPKPSPETSAFPLLIFTFEWITPLIWRGFRKPLEVADLYDLENKNRAEHIHAEMENSWQRFKNRRLSLLTSLLYTYGLHFFYAGCVKLFMDASNLAQPIFLRQILTILSDRNSSPSTGYYWILGLLGLNLVNLILNNHYFYIGVVLGFRVKSALIAMIYKKTLKLSHAARQRMTTGEITNLMAIDAAKFSGTIQYLHMLWSGLFQIATCLIFLFLYIGWSTVAGLVFMILLIPFQILFSRLIQITRKKILGFTDERVKNVSEILQGIKIIKFFTWEVPFLKSIGGIRSKELNQYRLMSLINGISTTLMSSSPTLVTVLTFLMYILLGNSLVPAIIFPAMSFFNLLRFPLSFFPTIITMTVEAKVSLDRMQRFLLEDEIHNEMVVCDPNTAIKVTDGQFTWSEANQVVGFSLSDINLDIKKGKLVMIIGSVGSGKSSLIHAVLGEMNQTKGSRSVNGSVGYCSQQAWIQNATIRDNILFGHVYDEAKFNQVIAACSLVDDFEILPDGDMTEIGEKGINLSGGQRQRVSLARALYSQSDLYILDDVLSAVDVHVGHHIFNQCIMGEMRNQTRILVTHQLQYLSRADHIIIVANGKILDQGNFDHIQDVIKTVFSNYVMTIEAQQEYKAEISEKKKTEKKDVKRLIVAEERAKGGVEFHVIWTYLKNMGPYLIIPTILLLLFLLTQVVLVSSDWWLSKWSSGAFTEISLVWKLVIYASMGVCAAICILFRNSLFLFTGLYAAGRLHNSMITRIMHAPMSFFESTPVGRILNRFSKDQEVADTELISNLIAFLGNLFQVITILIIIITVTPWFFLPLVPITLVYILLQIVYVRNSRELKRLDSITRSPLIAHFSETLTGISTIRAYQKEQYFSSSNHDKIDMNQKVNYPQMIIQRWLAVRLESIGALLIFFSGMLLMFFKSSTDPGLGGLALGYALQITGFLWTTIRLSTEVENSMNAIERLVYYIENVENEAPYQSEDLKAPDGWPSSSSIDLDHYSLRYRLGLPLVLHDVSLSIKDGEKIGVVGRTGAGKSSLMLALFRILEPASGKILIDHVNIATLGLYDLRRSIAIIPQEPILFSGTIRSNLDPFGEKSDDFLWDCLEKAHLKSFVSEYEEKLNHRVSEGGENLSVGQRQLMCLARALVKKSKILIMDEATASVDIKTDSLIQDIVKEEFKGSTILTIAHRLNTIINYDRILVLDHGKVVELDTPTNLVSKKGAFYSMIMEMGEENANSLMNQIQK